MKTTDLLIKLGRQIRQVRNSRALSQEKLAELAGVHPTYISEIELGKANASISVYEGIAIGLGITLSDLVQLQGEETDISLIALVSQVRNLNTQQRKTFIETITAVLKGMQDF